MNVVASGRDRALAGYDHSWYRFSALPSRAPLAWPESKRAAVAVLLDLRAAEWEAEPPRVPVPGGRGQAAFPDVPRLSHREFGHRVGVFRLIRMLSDLGLPWTAVVDVATVEHYPAVVERAVRPAAQVVAGGLSASRPLTSLMVAEEETHYVSSTLDRLEAALGHRPRGWMSPGWSESHRTPGVLAAAGLELVLDLGNDEQPYPMAGAEPLWCVPVSWELTDVAAVLERDVDPDVYADSVVAAVDRLVLDAPRGARMLCLHLHPWLSGEAFRARAVRRALTTLAERDDVWWTSPAALADHARRAGR
jgi:peptidoglycan/xylan/chitin deacetylase (PgdA/CDA1 family)